MTFVSQVVVFILALMGILFKSTKTDVSGKPVHTKYGLPLLTTTGKVVITLLTLSFLLSLLTGWQQAKSDEVQKNESLKRQQELNSQLESVKQQNQGLRDGIGLIIRAGASLSEEQKTNFESVLIKQTQTGDNIAENIDTSADLLRDRINDSISLLRLSKQEIERAGNPIKDVLVSFAAEVPMKEGALAAYRNRVENGIREHLKNSDNYGRVENGIDVTGMDLIKNYARQVSVDSTSSLIPNPQTDQRAFNLLNCLAMDIYIYKSVSSEQIITANNTPILEKLKTGSIKPDLSFPMSACLVVKNAKYDWASFSLKIFYNIESDSYGLAANDLPTNPANWTRNNKITSIPDLRGALMEVHLREKEPDLFHFGIKMSGGIVFMFRDDNMKRYVDQYGYPYYICQFPPN